MGAVVPGGWRQGPLPKLASEGWRGHGECLLSWSAVPLPIRASRLSVLVHDSEVDYHHPPSSSGLFSRMLCGWAQAASGRWTHSNTWQASTAAP